MARSITSSVGRMGARNVPQDVKTVQELLNKVRHGAGRPIPVLVQDAICGPKTISAIQKFQAHHFGWASTDGRVDPEGPTLRKLNEFDGPVPTPAEATPLTVLSVMLCPHGGHVLGIPTGSMGSNPPVLRAHDQFTVTGCPFRLSRGRPSPCVTVRWIGSYSQTLTRRSMGVCLNVEQVPQGQVIIVR